MISFYCSYLLEFIPSNYLLIAGLPQSITPVATLEKSQLRVDQSVLLLKERIAEYEYSWVCNTNTQGGLSKQKEWKTCLDFRDSTTMTVQLDGMNFNNYEQ